MLKQLPEVQASPELGTPQPVGTQPQTPLEEFTTVGHPHGSQAEVGLFRCTSRSQLQIVRMVNNVHLHNKVQVQVPIGDQKQLKTAKRVQFDLNI